MAYTKTKQSKRNKRKRTRNLHDRLWFIQKKKRKKEPSFLDSTELVEKKK